MNIILTVQIKLLPTKQQAQKIEETMQEYISLINDIVDYAVAIDRMPKLSSASVHAPLPSCLRDQCRLDAGSIWRKTIKKGNKFPTLKKPQAIWNNQNYSIEGTSISFPVWMDGKSQKISVRAIIPEDRLQILRSHKLGTLRLTPKNGKYIAQIAYEEACVEPSDGKVMGVDLGLRCPAVSVTEDGKTKFYGSGRRNRYVRRRYNHRRKKLGKAKKLDAIRKSKNKEERWMTDQDHQISRAIVNEALRLGVTTIKLEKLEGIRRTARTSRKNKHDLHNWSFYRLSKFIEYKAHLAGIEVCFVDPRYTSQTCPVCGKRHKTNSRTYVCPVCQYRTHRDRVGAVNICRAA